MNGNKLKEAGIGPFLKRVEGKMLPARDPRAVGGPFQQTQPEL